MADWLVGTVAAGLAIFALARPVVAAWRDGANSQPRVNPALVDDPRPKPRVRSGWGGPNHLDQIIADYVAAYYSGYMAGPRGGR